MKHTKTWRSLLLAALLSLTLIACSNAEEEPEVVQPPAADVNTLSVDTGVDVVSAEGQIVPLNYAELAFLTGGLVAELLVAEGESVTAGQPLMRLDAADLEAFLVQAEGGLAQAEAGIKSAEAQLQSAQTAVDSANVNVASAEAQLALILSDPLPEEIAALQSQIAAAQANVSQAAANRNLVAEGARNAQIQSLEAQLAAARAEFTPIQDSYDTIIRFEITGETEETVRQQLDAARAQISAAELALQEAVAGATQNELAAANAGVSAAIANQNSVESQLDLLLAGTQEEQIMVSEAAVEQAKGSVLQAEASLLQSEVGLETARAARDAAAASVASAQAALERMTLTAPFDGSAAQINFEVGELVPPNLSAITVADLDGWQVETTDLTELDVVAVEVGLPVVVRVDALPDAAIPGIVTDIDTLSTLNRGDVTYAVTVDLQDTEDLPLRWGMTVFIDIDVAE